MRLLAAAVLALVGAGGCQQPEPSAPAAGPAKGPLTAQLKAEGDALMARGDFEKAVEIGRAHV